MFGKPGAAHHRKAEPVKGLWFIVAGAALTLAACATTKTEFPLTPAQSQQRVLAKSCEGRDGWSDAAPPARIFGNTYYVGTCGITVLLVTGPEGHVLIDGATEAAVPSILANIRALGFDPKDIRLIVGSHEHVDHMGGIAALKTETGAKIMVADAAAFPVLATGQVAPDDPQHGIIENMRPMLFDATLGFTSERTKIDVPAEWAAGLQMTAHATPGHTTGSTSWTWKSCERTNCATFAYVDSLTAVSREGYRFSDHPERVAPFRVSFARVNRMPCDILLTPHPSVSNMFQRLAGTEPLVDRDACRRLVHAMQKRLDDRLAKEAAETP